MYDTIICTYIGFLRCHKSFCFVSSASARRTEAIARSTKKNSDSRLNQITNKINLDLVIRRKSESDWFWANILAAQSVWPVCVVYFICCRMRMNFKREYVFLLIFVDETPVSMWQQTILFYDNSSTMTHAFADAYDRDEWAILLFWCEYDIGFQFICFWRFVCFFFLRWLFGVNLISLCKGIDRRQ